MWKVGMGCLLQKAQSVTENFYQPVMDKPSEITLKDVLSKPESIPERSVTEHLVRRLLEKSPEEQTKRVSTHGQVSHDV